jgi:hypothetical protein
MTKLTDFDALAEWLSDYIAGPVRISVFPLLPSAEGGVMPGPIALDVYVPAHYDDAAILETTEIADLVGVERPAVSERYISWPFDGGHVVINEPEFEYASVVSAHQIMVYMVGGIGLAIQEDRTSREREQS